MKAKVWKILMGTVVLVVLCSVVPVPVERFFVSSVSSYEEAAARAEDWTKGMLQRAPVDTIRVRSFADECFEKQYPGVDFKETSVSLRTNRSDMFVVEYWWEAENQKQHYGYQIQSDGEQCQHWPGRSWICRRFISILRRC